jgi:hypothetical protein
MFTIFNHFFGYVIERFFGIAPLLGGVVLAIAGWFFDYAAREWRIRLGYSLVMWAAGLSLIGLVLYLDWDVKSLVYCMIWGVLMYLPLPLSMCRAS